MKATVLISAPYNARVAERGAEGDWVYIQTDNGVSGWMMRDLTRRGAMGAMGVTSAAAAAAA